MPKFYFHVHDSLEAEDEEGLELPNAAAAYEEAVRGARSIMGAEVAQGRLSLKGCIEIADESGTLIRKVPFREAVVIEG